VLPQRRFLFLLGAVTAGLWLPTTGLVPVEHAFVIKHAGTCTFCGKRTSEVRALFGICGGVPRICNECIMLCCDIVREEAEADRLRVREHRSYPVIESHRLADRYRIDDLLRQTAERYEPRHDAEVEEVLHSLMNKPDDRLERETVSSPVDEFHCSFCGAARSQVAKLISGARVFICDVCTGDAVSVLAHVLPA
jgi:hypothetical protein